MAEPVAAANITALILAGGRGSRLGGADKGLQTLQGQPLVRHVLQRLQQGGGVAGVMIAANRNLPAYQALGVPVVSDGVQGFAGPLAGFLAGLRACTTPWLLTVACDTPLLPLDLAQRLGQAAAAAGADIAMASAPGGPQDPAGSLRCQPTTCLLRTCLADDLQAFLAGGGRRVMAWAQRHRRADVAFNAPRDDPWAFYNLNTPEDLQFLEHQHP